MALFCFVTEQVKHDASSHGIKLDKVERFAKDVEERQSLAGFDHFPPPCLTKKKVFGFNFRLIAAEKLVGEHLVVVLLRLIVRGGNEYTSFLRDPAAWATRFLEVELSEQKLAAWVQQRTQLDPPQRPPGLSSREQTFLWTSGSGHVHDDAIICETHQWVESAADPRINDRLIRLPELIIQALDGHPGKVQCLAASGDDRLKIQTFVVPETKQCVLLRASYGDSDERLTATARDWEHRLLGAGTEDVLRHCQRSYPSIICCDEDLWMTVERDPQANMALSPEEADILRSASFPQSQTPVFPLFINGRAGSGKSTLLQYLFAQSFLRWAQYFNTQDEADSAPLYFASSGELLKVARDVVNRLLCANHEYLLARAEHDLDQTDLDRLIECFKDTLEFMRRAVGADADVRFPMSKHVTYARFRRLWMKRFGKERRAIREFGPQISWHVIRGLIKGMSIDDLLGRDDYDELPEDEKTISRDVYETIFDKVWLAWYDPLCRSGEVWDSQDLVRVLLKEERLPASHVAIFCDEAQDFTRVELEAIYRCSLFSNRIIDFQDAKRIPFVFAGDPFQTLNPTGFRWESVRAAFTERILRSLYRFNSRTQIPSLPYRELTFNYRSTTRIVHLCNSIQAVRAWLFGQRSLRPQNTWQTETESPSPVFFEKGDPNLEDAIRNQSDLVLIVPCEEGEEVDYVAGDEYLRRLVQTDDDGTPRNVLSAARAKGLEFLRVALYGWSSRDEAKAIAKLLTSAGAQEIGVDQRLGLEYFLNNLYVAASRAQRRLFVIDDKTSRDALWWFAIDDQNLRAICCDLPEATQWQQNTGLLFQGVLESFAKDQDDPRTIAERFKSEGLTKQDSYLLKQASQHYNIAGDERQARICRARAHWFDQKYKEAGQSFEKASAIDDAVNAYWHGKLYGDIVDCVTRHPGIAKHPRCRMARFLHAKNRTIRECASLFEQLSEMARVSPDVQNDMKSILWKEAIGLALGKPFSKRAKDAIKPDKEDASKLADVLSSLASTGVVIEPRALARVLFAARRFDEVLQVIGEDDGSELYRDARAMKLIRQRDSEGHAFTRSETLAVADYFFRQKQYEQASQYYAEILDTGRMLNCLQQTVEQDRVHARMILKRTVAVLIEAAEWENVASLLETGQPAVQSWSKSIRDGVRDTIRENMLDLKVAVPALARSDKLSLAHAKSQHRVSSLLADKLVNSSNATWRKVLPMHIAGAAIERAGKDLDALKFYEQWRDTAASAKERSYATQRWVVCKLRQADREEKEGHTRKAKSYRKDARAVMEEYGWLESDVVDVFPNLEVTSLEDAGGEAEKPASPGSLAGAAKPNRQEGHGSDGRGTLGNLVYRLIVSKGWVNIESDDGLRARVHILERTVTSDDLIVRECDESECECVEWGLHVRWIDGKTIELRAGESVRNISLQEKTST